MFNFSSRVLKQLLFQDLDMFFREQFHGTSCTVSPLAEVENTGTLRSADFTLEISNPARTFNIEICTAHFSPRDREACAAFLKTSLYQIELVLSILFNYRYHAVLREGSRHAPENIKPETPLLYMELSPSTGRSGAAFTVRIPGSFFRLFSPDLTGHFSPETAEAGIVSFFRDPSHLFPGISMILETFSDRELQELLFQLQKKNLLTTYQICLVLYGLPEKALRLKRNVSRNTIHDVAAMMRRFSGSGSIQRRDLIGGLYSIEEAVYFLIRGGTDFSYSSFLHGLQHTVKMMSRFELLLIRSFPEWLAEMEEHNLLYGTLSASRETDIAGAISDAPEQYLPVLSRYISGRRIADISRLAETLPVSFTERVNARAEMIYHYRKLRMEQRNLGDESFEYLLRRFKTPAGYRHLLYSAGWFTLSTALKGLPRVRVKPVLDSLPRPPRYLIEDVLRGVVNPGIIHDEMQVHSARGMCVKAIITLSDDGMIELIE